MKQPRYETMQPSGPNRKKMRFSELTAREIFDTYLQNFASLAVASDQQTDKVYRQFVDSPSHRLKERKALHGNFRDSLKRNILENSKLLSLAKYSIGKDDHRDIKLDQIEGERMNSIFLHFVAAVCEDFLEQDTESPLPVLVLQKVLIRLFEPDTQDILWKDQLFDSMKNIDQDEEINIASFASLLFHATTKYKRIDMTQESFVYICIG